jgi:hypothetical protein
MTARTADGEADSCVTADVTRSGWAFSTNLENLNHLSCADQLRRPPIVPNQPAAYRRNSPAVLNRHEQILRV